MKPLGGGHLIAEREAALDYILNLDDCIDTIAIGMQSVNEVEYNCRRFSGENRMKNFRPSLQRCAARC